MALSSDWRRLYKVHFRKSREPIARDRGQVGLGQHGEAFGRRIAVRDQRRPALGKIITGQVYSAIKQLIVAGDLAAGKRLPSSRTIARELDISRTTAIAVFERLTSEGLIVSRTGSGSFVSDVAEAQRPRARADRRRTSGRRRPSSPTSSRRPRRASSSGWRIRRSRAPSSPACRPTTPFRWRSGRGFRQNTGASRATSSWAIPIPTGSRALRQAIAEHLRANRGIACDAEQIFIVNGAQQAFDLIGRVLLNRGDPVWFENPGAIGARNSFIACGATMVPVPVDAEGMSVEAGLRLAPDFRLAFVTPVAPAPDRRRDEPRAPRRPAARRQRARRLDRRGRL